MRYITFDSYQYTFLCIWIIAHLIQHPTLAERINQLRNYAFNPTYLRYSAGLKPTAWMQDGVYPFNDSKNYSPAKNKRFWNNVKSAWMFKPYFPMAMRMRAIAISKYSSPNSNEKTNGSQLKDSTSEYMNNDASINKLTRRSPLLFRVT